MFFKRFVACKLQISRFQVELLVCATPLNPLTYHFRLTTLTEVYVLHVSIDVRHVALSYLMQHVYVPGKPCISLSPLYTYILPPPPPPTGRQAWNGQSTPHFVESRICLECEEHKHWCRWCSDCRDTCCRGSNLLMIRCKLVQANKFLRSQRV